MPAPPPSSVGLWGTFDLENYGDHLFPLITRRELERRLGPVELRTFSPLGWMHPTRLDAGEPAEPLGEWTQSRCEQLSAELDVILVGGGEIIHTRDEILATAYGLEKSELLQVRPSRFFIEGLGAELERDCPVLWQAVGVPFDPSPDEAAMLRNALAKREYVTVRDEISVQRLLAADVGTEIGVVPDLAFLLDRLFDRGVLDRRLRYLQLMGWYPGDEARHKVLVVQGNRDLVRFVSPVAAAVSRFIADRPDWSVVLAELGACHGDREFADAMEAALAATEPPISAFRLPTEAGVEDIVTAISSAGAFLGISMHGSITAFVFGRPFVTLNLNDQSKLRGLGRTIGRPDVVVSSVDEIEAALEAALRAEASGVPLAALQASVDDHFDAVASIIESAASSRLDDAGSRSAGQSARPHGLQEQLRATREAYRIKSSRVASERMRFADQVQELRSEVRRLEATVAALEQGLRAEHELTVAATAACDELAVSRQLAEEELGRIRATKTFRFLDPLRRVYGRMRR